ncbi:unnamed protein product, partial [Mesorhabditis spiculigera]
MLTKLLLLLVSLAFVLADFNLTDCNKSGGKGCLFAPPQCQPNVDCKVHISYRVEGADLVIELGGTMQPEQYMAVGFSLSGAMKETSVSGCYLNTDSKIHGFVGYIPSKREVEMIPWDLQRLDHDASSYEDGRLVCTLRRQMSETNYQLIYDLNAQEYTILTARGPYKGALRKHEYKMAIGIYNLHEFDVGYDSAGYGAHYSFALITAVLLIPMLLT